LEGVAATCNVDESEAVAEADTDGELLADVEALFARDCDGDGVVVTDAEALDEPVDDCDEMRGRHASERSRTSGAARADMVPLRWRSRPAYTGDGRRLLRLSTGVSSS
jgi:hypothetical protein